MSSLGARGHLVVDPTWLDDHRAKPRLAFSSAYQREAPCDKCEHRQQCAAKELACGAYVAWFRKPANPKWRELRREPSARAFAAAHDDAPTKLGCL